MFSGISGVSSVFSSILSTTDVADTTRTMVNVRDHACSSLRQNGDAYWFGTSWTGPGANHDTIEKFNVDSGGNATDVGDLTVDRNDSVSAAH